MNKEIFDEVRSEELDCGMMEYESTYVDQFSDEAIHEYFDKLYEKLENTEYEIILRKIQFYNDNNRFRVQIFEKDNRNLQNKIYKLKSIVESVFTEPEYSWNWTRLGYEYGGYSLDTDSKMPFMCYKKAVELSNNDPYYCYLLAECYEKGVGTEKNLEKAFEYYSLATKDNHSYFIKKLADCYKNGIGTTIDEYKAQELYEKAKALDYEASIQQKKKTFEGLRDKLTEVNIKNINSWISLGDCYKNGRGTEKDLSKATDCYNKVLEYYDQTKAFDKNYQIVLKHLKELKNGVITKQDQILMLEKELTEVTQDNVRTWISLGDLYKKLNPKNYQKAYECYKKVYNFYEQIGTYDENYRRALNRLLVCFDKEIVSDSKGEKDVINQKLRDYEYKLFSENSI